MPSDVQRQAFKGSLKLCKTFNVYLKLLISILHSTLPCIICRQKNECPTIQTLSQYRNVLVKTFSKVALISLLKKQFTFSSLESKYSVQLRRGWSLESGVWTHHSFYLQTIKLGRGRITPKSDRKLHNLMIADLKTFNKKYCYLQSNKNFQLKNFNKRKI